ncbi:MAG TPA: enoyl-CoA hydratase-related protein [Halanaerobiales bacterium]|nr:enoyl-CoA hydratase-related protein [Halanaerobiales bacterium]
MDFKNIITKTEGKKAVIEINRPEALNALNIETLLEIEEAMQLISEDKNIRVVVITGTGDKAFIAGADIKEMKDMEPVQAESFANLGQRVFNKIENCRKPVIAAVNGHALGGGCELALACDIRIASENAQFGQPEVGLGILPGFGGTQRLGRIIGEGLAREYIYTGRYISAKRAQEIGLVNHLVKLDKLDDKVDEIVEEIIHNSPCAISQAKKAINFSANAGKTEGMEYEAQLFGLCFSAYDQKEGMQAFINREKPEFEDKSTTPPESN